MKLPLVSIIIPTKNEESNIKNCLESIKNQTYKNIEIVIVDNSSSDRTKEIALIFTKKVFNHGPERTSQRNFGAAKARGDYLLFIDADMILEKKVVRDCIDLIIREDIDAIIIPERSFGESFWAKCKALERSFYLGIEWIEAPRFISKKTFGSVGGYDEDLVSGEDWDLAQRIKREHTIGRIKSFILHNEGNLSLFNLLKKKFYYATKIRKYSMKKVNNNSAIQFSPFERYKLFFSNPKKLLRHPLIGAGMLFMKSSEFVVGGVGAVFFSKK